MVAGMLVTLPAASFTLSLAGPSPLPIIMLNAFLWGMGIEIMMILWFTALQTHIPKDAIGRVSAYDAFGSVMLGPVGLALAGPLSQNFGTQPVLICAAALTVVMVLLSLVSKDVRNLRYIEPTSEATA
jgi:predicted MFS family arabinose efflux permease